MRCKFTCIAARSRVRRRLAASNGVPACASGANYGNYGDTLLRITVTLYSTSKSKLVALVFLQAGLPALAAHQSTLGPGFRLSPKTTGTDGFYIATLTQV
jgi:hypothetical protein